MRIPPGADAAAAARTADADAAEIGAAKAASDADLLPAAPAAGGTSRKPISRCPFL